MITAISDIPTGKQIREEKTALNKLLSKNYRSVQERQAPISKKILLV